MTSHSRERPVLRLQPGVYSKAGKMLKKHLSNKGKVRKRKKSRGHIQNPHSLINWLD